MTDGREDAGSASTGAIRYIAPSALLSAIVERDPAAARAIRRRGRRVTSALTIAESYRALVRTLDAIHLATAELLGEPPVLVTIVTRDTHVRENAVALGYPTE